MRVRDLERLLTAQGVGAAKIDGITRKLRESGRLPLGGRGTNAPVIGAREAAIILIAVAGSAKANEADERMRKLESLRCTAEGKASALVEAITSLLEDRPGLDAVAEIRVSRTRRRAAFHFRDGRIGNFLPSKPDGRVDRFSVEGILSGPLLKLVADALAGGKPK